MYYDIDKIPTNLEINNTGALLSKSGIIYKISIFNSFFAIILNNSENKEDATAKFDEYLSKLENNDYNYFLSKFKISENYSKYAKISYDKLSKMFSKKALIYCLTAAVSGNGGYILFIFSGMVGIEIASPIFVILGIFLFYFIKKKLEDYLKEKNSENFQTIIKKLGIFLRNQKILN